MLYLQTDDMERVYAYASYLLFNGFVCFGVDVAVDPLVDDIHCNVTSCRGEIETFLFVAKKIYHRLHEVMTYLATSN